MAGIGTIALHSRPRLVVPKIILNQLNGFTKSDEVILDAVLLQDFSIVPCQELRFSGKLP
jgi:hypothetical protein